MLRKKDISAPLEMSIKNKKNNSLTGFTLIELSIVIAILAILAVVAFPRMVDMPVMRLDMAARNIQSGIRYTQSLAISIQKRTGIYFRTVQDDYRVYIEDTPGSWILATNPLTRQNFRVQLNSGEFAGVDLTSAYFNQEGRALVFDRWGNPYSYDVGSGVASLLNNPAGVRLAIGSSSKNVRVERGTARVYIE